MIGAWAAPYYRVESESTQGGILWGREGPVHSFLAQARVANKVKIQSTHISRILATFNSLQRMPSVWHVGVFVVVLILLPLWWRFRWVQLLNPFLVTGYARDPTLFAILHTSAREGSFWAYIFAGQDPSDSKSNRIHVRHLPVLMLSFIRGISYKQIPLKRSVVNFLTSWTSTTYFLDSTGSSRT